MSASACVSPVSALTWTEASASGTDAEAMSGGLALAGFEGAGSAADLSGADGIAVTHSHLFRRPRIVRSSLCRARVILGYLILRLCSASMTTREMMSRALY